MQKNRILANCPACEGTKKVKNVKTWKKDQKQEGPKTTREMTAAKF